MELQEDGDGLVCRDHSKVIMTNEQLEELWENYGFSSKEQNPADMAAAMREYYSEKRK